jgi:hypothetical protein
MLRVVVVMMGHAADGHALEKSLNYAVQVRDRCRFFTSLLGRSLKIVTTPFHNRKKLVAVAKTWPHRNLHDWNLYKMVPPYIGKKKADFART